MVTGTVLDIRAGEVHGRHYRACRWVRLLTRVDGLSLKRVIGHEFPHWAVLQVVLQASLQIRQDDWPTSGEAVRQQRVRPHPPSNELITFADLAFIPLTALNVLPSLPASNSQGSK